MDQYNGGPAPEPAPEGPMAGGAPEAEPHAGAPGGPGAAHEGGADEHEAAGAGGPDEHEQPGRRVQIDLIEGDATIVGGAPQVLLTSHGVRAEDHIVHDVGGELRFRRMPGGSELHVPDGSRVGVRTAYGDLRVLQLDGFIAVQRVHGDVELDGVAVADFGDIGSDLEARHGGALRVQTVGGDAGLEDYDEAPLLGRVGGDLEARALPGLEVRDAVGGEITLERCGEVRLFGTVGGDLRAEETSVALRASAVGGDVELSAAQGVTLAAVGGDLSIEEAAGAVEVHSVGGDASLKRTRAAVRLGTVGGDLVAEEAQGGLVAGRVGGDAELDTALAPGAEYNVHAGGDISLRVRGDVNARFVAQAMGGEIRTRLPLSVERGRRRNLVGVIGRGDATVTLRSGGDITLTAADRFEEEHEMGDEFVGGGADRDQDQAGPRTWETAFGKHRFRVQWDRQPGRANFRFKGPFAENDDPDAMGSGTSRDWNMDWERGRNPRFTGEYQQQFNEAMERVEKTARKAAEQAQEYAEKVAKRARDTDWESVGREVRTAVERAMGEIENAFGQVRGEWERRSGPQQGGSGGSGTTRPNGPQRVRIEMDEDADQAGAASGGFGAEQQPAANRDDVEARRRAILEQLRNGTLSLDEAERQLNELR